MRIATPIRLAEPSTRHGVKACQDGADIRLGMPHLSCAGVSENWLLKELGHRHWTMLSNAAGMESPDFRDEEGRPVYAAFCAIRFEDARLELGRENGRFAIRSAMRRVSRTQVESRHEFLIDGLPGGRIEMVSTFVRRTARSNHAVARVALDGLMSIDQAPSDLAALAASLRANRLPRHLGFDLISGPEEITEFTFDPCPHLDFNGAGFLYFPSFLAFVDRAEWQLDRRTGQLLRRETFYHGNVDPNVPIRVVLAAQRIETGDRWWRIERTEDRSVLADVFVQREQPA